MKKIIVLAIAVLLIFTTAEASSNGCIDPTGTPRPTHTPFAITHIPKPPKPTPTDHRGMTTIIPFPDPTKPPKHKKTKVPPVYATQVECMSDCEFKAEVIDLLEQILAEVRK